MNPDKFCNFDCAYCEVDRSRPSQETHLDVVAMAGELERTLVSVNAGRLRELPAYRALPEEWLHLRHVALSGDGEPTLCPNFTEAVCAVLHARARGVIPFFKVVLITNATGLDLAEVRQGLSFFTSQDEVWAKLDAGTQACMDRVNRPQVPLERVLANILSLARQRPVVIQSLFPLLDGRAPDDEEIGAFAQRLRDLKRGGAQISLVQIHSATRPTPHSECGHLPLKTLSSIARRVGQATGLPVEVF